MQQLLVEEVRDIEFEDNFESSTKVNFIPILGLVSFPIFFGSLLLPLHKASLPVALLQYSPCHRKSRVAIMEFQCDGQAEV